MGREAGDLVSESLGLDSTDVIDDSLVYMEVVGQPRQDRKRAPLVKFLTRGVMIAYRQRIQWQPLTFRSTSQ